MNRKTIITFVVALLAVGGGSFYGGMKYSQSKAPSRGNFGQNFQNLTPEERQLRMQSGDLSGGARTGGNRMPGGVNGGFVNGDIIAKDDKSITVKGRDGGSKIVFFSDKTQIVEAVGGKIDDLAVGKNVVVNGTANPDGSMTGQMIQVRLIDQNASTTPAGR